jgi:hypothetical protein
MTDCNLSSTQSIELLLFHTFCPSFLLFFYFYQLDLLTAASTFKVIVVLTYPLSRRCLAGGEALSSSASGAPDYRRNR